MSSTGPTPAGGYIFRAWITLPDGKRLYARDCGLKAFRIPVKSNPKTEKK